ARGGRSSAPWTRRRAPTRALWSTSSRCPRGQHERVVRHASKRLGSGKRRRWDHCFAADPPRPDGLGPPSENRYGRPLAPESPSRQPAGMPAEPRLSVFLFGPPRIERDGKPVEPDTRKAIALLAYLAVTAHPEGRERLAALLRPEATEEHARGALPRTP